MNTNQKIEKFIADLQAHFRERANGEYLDAMENVKFYLGLVDKLNSYKGTDFFLEGVDNGTQT